MANKKPRRFVYWVSVAKNDNQCYSLIGLTKKSVVDQLASGRVDPKDYALPEKRMIEYSDLFDFFAWVTGEGGGRDTGISFTTE